MKKLEKVTKEVQERMFFHFYKVDKAYEEGIKKGFRNINDSSKSSENVQTFSIRYSYMVILTIFISKH